MSSNFSPKNFTFLISIISSMKLFAVLILTIVCSLTNGTSDKKTSLSVASLVPLLEMERQLINNLEEYTIDLKQKLQILESQIAAMRAENEKGYADPLAYVSNPLNGLSLIRRLNQDWVMWRKFMQKPVGVLQMRTLDLWLKKLPTNMDLYSACAGIIRIRDYYDLKLSDIIRGNLFRFKYNVSMSVPDLYAMGQHLFENDQFLCAIPLLQDVLQRIREEPFPMGPQLNIEELDVIKLLVQSYVQSQQYLQALSILEEGLELSSSDAFLIREKENALRLMKETPTKEKPTKKCTIVNKKHDIWKNTKECCKGTYKSNNRLMCYYNSSTTPFLRIAPFKTEQIGLDPYVVVFHDVLSPREISKLISLTDRKLVQAVTVNKKSFKEMVRTAKAHWVYRGYQELTKRIYRRIHDMSGFELADAENFQIVNYGIGGHYGEHKDYFNASSSFFTGYHRSQTKKYLGDRIATVLFYLSDVEQGGATVFPGISADSAYTVYPRAGTAAMWYNLHTDGLGDPTTLHVACPVIVGSKWVMTQWIRERSQIFARPCLEPSPSLNPS
ncbi:prolyl 4-hydroxylase subunit alpha-2 [Drosophila ananassae]|nr:prolyl 4-hydroxylase subunit alpha-2 [Drosophila ananassae]